MTKKMNITNIKRRLGSTLIEVIVATGVVAVVMTTVVAAVSVAVRNTALAKEKIVATKYTSEGIEYFRTQRQVMGWETFYSAAQLIGSSTTLCLKDLPYTDNGGIETVPKRECADTDTVDPKGLYTRTAKIIPGTTAAGQYVRVTVTVNWDNGDRTLISTASAELRPK